MVNEESPCPQEHMNGVYNLDVGFKAQHIQVSVYESVEYISI